MSYFFCFPCPDSHFKVLCSHSCLFKINLQLQHTPVVVLKTIILLEPFASVTKKCVCMWDHYLIPECFFQYHEKSPKCMVSHCQTWNVRLSPNKLSVPSSSQTKSIILHKVCALCTHHRALLNVNSMLLLILIFWACSL